jgi:hypothetical protein
MMSEGKAFEIELSVLLISNSKRKRKCMVALVM